MKSRLIGLLVGILCAFSMQAQVPTSLSDGLTNRSEMANASYSFSGSDARIQTACPAQGSSEAAFSAYSENEPSGFNVQAIQNTISNADEVIPAAPTHYFNDYAGIISSESVSKFDSMLQKHEQESSDQIVVAIFPKMQSRAPMDDYTTRVFNSWEVGQKGKNNGVVIFVFVQDRKMRIQVGRGLERVLSNAACRQIIDSKIKPSFKARNFDEGLSAGLEAIIAALKAHQ